MFDETQEQRARTPGDYWAIVVRQRWVILGATFICWLAVWAVGWLLPSTYDSTAQVLVQQQQVSPDLVQPNLTVSMDAELQSIENQVLVPSKLQPIIDEYRLYPKHSGLLGLLQPGDSAEKMRTKDIKVVPVDVPTHSASQEGLIAFNITYSGPSPDVAQAVNAKLTDLFITQNNVTQQQLSQTTTNFLKTELDDAQANLDKQEADIKAFKTQHAGELPDQLQGNLQILSGLQEQLENNSRSLSAAQQQKLYLQSMQQQYQSAESQLGNTESGVAPSTLDEQLKTLEMQLAQERSQYTDSYPDVIALKDQIEKTKQLKKQTEEQIASQHKSDRGDDNAATTSTVGLQNGPTPMMQIQSQLKSNQLEIQSLQADQKKIQAQIEIYQGRLKDSPIIEQEYDGISRGFDAANKDYDTLLQKYEQAQLATNVAQNQQGEQFTLVASPTLPAEPSAPNHILISLGGLAAGIVLGLGLAVLLEFTDIRIRKEADLEGVISARVLVGIPKLSTPMEERRRHVLRWVERGAVLAMFVIVVAGNIYSFLKG
jgi:polysaccharide biosynthesis transport protein